MKPLEPPDSHLVRAAEGWLGLGNPREAAAELDQLSSRGRLHPEALDARWKVYAAADDWSGCVETAGTLVDVAPRSPGGWIHRSFALHKLKRTREAADLLLPAAQLFPDNWLVRYNLACYACQLGNHTSAWDWLQNAYELGHERQIRLMALADVDLEPIRAKIASEGKPKG